jgi:hypothetical protein
LADAEDVTVGVAHVHLPKAKGLIAWRLEHLQPLTRADLVQGVHVSNDEGQPDAVWSAATLPVQAEEDLTLA